MKDLNAKSAWADTLPSQWGPESAKIEIPLGEQPPAPSAGAASTMAPAPAKLSLWDWMREGLRAALFLSPRTAAAAPSPWQVLVLSLLGGALLVGAARVQGAVAHKPDLWGGAVAGNVFWVAYGVLTLWVLATLVVVSARFIRSRLRTAIFSVAMAAVIGVGMWQFQDQPWELDALAAASAQSGEEGQAQPEPAHLVLSQAVFENQQALWDRQEQALPAGRDGVVDVYGLVFAPYASENVFRRESTMVSTLLQERFDAQGRVVHLLNHAETADTHAWATPQNLQRAIAALAQRMDRDSDVLAIDMTSNGARNHELAASHWPPEVTPATPEMLRAMLAEAGIAHRR